MLRDVFAVSGAGRYAVRVPITAYNCHDVAREDLQPAFLALVLACAFSDRVNMAVRTLHMPRPIQTGPRRSWKGRDDANCSSCSDQFLDEFPSRVRHLPLLEGKPAQLYMATLNETPVTVRSEAMEQCGAATRNKGRRRNTGHFLDSCQEQIAYLQRSK